MWVWVCAGVCVCGCVRLCHSDASFGSSFAPVTSKTAEEGGFDADAIMRELELEATNAAFPITPSAGSTAASASAAAAGGGVGGGAGDSASASAESSPGSSPLVSPLHSPAPSFRVVGGRATLGANAKAATTTTTAIGSAARVREEAEEQEEEEAAAANAARARRTASPPPVTLLLPTGLRDKADYFRGKWHLSAQELVKYLGGES